MLFFDKNKINFFVSKIYAYKPSCYLVRSLFKDSKNFCNEACLEINQSLNFGNAMIQLLRVTQIAKTTNMTEVYFPRGFLHINKSFSLYGIQFRVKNESHNPNCYSHFFEDPIFDLPKTPYEIEDQFKDLIYSLFYNISVPDDVLVLYFRSGDIFTKKRVDYHYAQPPCSYYRDVINKKKWSDVILISQDNSNPCVDVISKYVNKSLEIHDLNTDISILLNAKNIAFEEALD